MICKNCNCINNEDARFCRQCGSPLNAKPDLTLFPEEIRYQANFNVKYGNSLGGHLHIFRDHFIFRPHKFNFGDLSQRVFPISEIANYRKGMLTFLYIDFVNGESIKLTVWKKQEIINELEARRRALLNL